MDSYDIVLSEATLAKVKSYLCELQSAKVLPGERLQNRLTSIELPDLAELDLLRALLATKKPQLFAESEVRGDGSDWTLEELSILGDIGVSVPVVAFDNGLHVSPVLHQPPISATLMFIPGALLRSGQGTPADWNEVTDFDELDDASFNGLYQRRLLPLLLHTNKLCGERDKKAIVTVPGLGCGQFAGPFSGRLGEKLKAALINILEQHGAGLPFIKAIYFDPYNECVNERFEIEGVSLFVRPLLQNNAGKAQLCLPQDYQEQGDDFCGCEIFSVVAWDHASWPGNDFYIGARATDDGVKAAATDVMQSMTGVAGEYNLRRNCYDPPAEYTNWEQVVDSEQLVFGQEAEVCTY